MTENQTTITPNSTLLVTGGAKGITAQCVIALAQRFGCRFVLLGRSAIQPEPTWSEGVTEEAALKKAAMQVFLAEGQKPKPADVGRAVSSVLAGREIRATLDAVAEAGGHADYVSADVTDVDALAAALAPHHATITGILHGAGALADKVIQDKSEADFEKVVATKVDGLLALLAAIPAEQLRQLVLFSSVAGFYGNPGQADYALANAALDKLAYHIRQTQPHCRVLTVNWGPWDGGMVTPALKRALAARGVSVIPVDIGTALLADELAAEDGPTQLVIGSALKAPVAAPSGALQTHRIRRRLTLEANPFLRDHVIGGNAVLPTVCAVAWMVRACEGLFPGYTFFSADNYQALKGIVFDGTEAAEHTLEVQEVAKSADEIACDALIRSETPEGKPRFHYRARITLRRELPVAPVYAEANFHEAQRVDGDTLYSDGTLFHGPAFRGVAHLLNIGPDALTTRCVLPEVAPDVQGQFPAGDFNPYLSDVQLQSLLIWAKHTYGYGGLPLRIARGEQYRKVNFGEETFASLRVQSASETSLVADVISHDAQGRIISRVFGAEITLSPRLNEMFAQNQLT